MYPKRRIAPRNLVDRQRHVRMFWYASVALALAVSAYLFLGFDRVQTLGYAVACFVMLNLLNFRAMYTPHPGDSDRPPVRE